MKHGTIPGHKEPDCTSFDNGCGYWEPHKHGFDCDKTCTECNGYCHVDCPANEAKKKQLEVTGDDLYYVRGEN